MLTPSVERVQLAQAKRCRRSDGALAVLDPLQPVAHEEPGVARAEERKADLQRPAGLPPAAKVAHDEALPRVEERDRARHPALLDGRVGVREREIVDVGAELPLELAPLAPAEQVRLFEPEEAADAGALPQRRAEVDVAGALLLDPEHHIDVHAVLGWPHVGRRQRLLEVAQVADVLVRADQQLAVEQVARQQHDRLADHPLVGDVVADDLDLVQRRRLILPGSCHPRSSEGLPSGAVRRVSSGSIRA